MKKLKVLMKRLVVRALVCLLAFFLIGLHLLVFAEGAEVKIKSEELDLKPIKQPSSFRVQASPSVTRSLKVTNASRNAVHSSVKSETKTVQRGVKFEVVKPSAKIEISTTKPAKIAAAAPAVKSVISSKPAVVKPGKISSLKIK